MKKYSTRTWFKYGLLSALLFNVNPAMAEWVKDKTYFLTLLHTNDHHGHFWENSKGETGLAARKQLIDQIRAEVKAQGGDVLLLDAGDVNTGTPESDLLFAEPDFKGMDIIGYDAMTLGNHEFDNPLAVLQRQQQWVKFPFLASNIYRKGSDQRLFTPYKVFDKQGLKVAVIGVTTVDTARLGSKKTLADIEFRPHVAEVNLALAELSRDTPPDITIGLTHLGFYENAQYGSNAPGDVTLARQLPPGALNMIIGGHSHTAVCFSEQQTLQTDYVPGTPCVPDRQNGSWIFQSLDTGKFVGRADFTFKNGEMTLVNYQLLPVNLKKSVESTDGKKNYQHYGQVIDADPQLLAFLEQYKQQGEQQLGVVLGNTPVRLEGDRQQVRQQQTNMGELIVRAQMARTEAGLGLMSSGSVRAAIDAGPITYRDVLTVQPFGNTVVYVEMRGDELRDYLQVVANKQPGSGAYAQFANLSFELQGEQLQQVKIAGQDLQLDKVYRLSMPSYNASGGDGYPNLLDHPSYVNTGFIDAEVLQDYIKQTMP